jgi:hypothetical protein
LPQVGFKFKTWGDTHNTKEAFIIFNGQEDQNYSVRFIEE